VGDRLDGSPEPTMGGKKTPDVGGKSSKRRSRADKGHAAESGDKEERYQQAQLELTLRGVTDAFQQSHDGYSADRIVADPELNLAFVETCQRFGLAGDARTWNTLLFRLRKAGKLATIETSRQTTVSWDDCDDYLFASEIALQILLDASVALSIDEILCDPLLAEQFDETASRFAPGHAPLEYRWAALKLRKQAKTARNRSSVLKPPSRLGDKIPVKELNTRKLPDAAGVYVVGEHGSSKLYVGEATNLRHRLGLMFSKPQKKAWKGFGKSIVVQTMRADISTAGRLAWQSCLVKKYKQRPRLNYAELRST
jgi:site-specific DNA-methyltransferase (adenine-specific)